MRMKGSRAIVRSLENENVKVIFGIPGGATIPLFDDLYDSSIRTILVRHEQGAAHAAEGYARVCGEVGVCTATSGPGATNLTTGIADAYLDSSPVVAFTGQVATPFLGKDAFQEADTMGITMPITKHNFQLRSVEEIPAVIKTAFTLARTGRPGPVVIDMPKDMQEKEADITFPKNVDIEGYKPTLKGHIRQIKKAAEMLLDARMPIIFAGGGVIISGAERELYDLSTMLQAPVTTSLMGKGAFPEDHPLSLGMVGMHGRKAANYAINDADVILAVGVRFSDRSTGAVSCFAPEAKIIHVDIDPAEIGKNVRVDLPVVGDAKLVLQDMVRLIEAGIKKGGKGGKGGRTTAWQEKVKRYIKEFQPRMDYEDIPLHPARVIKEIMGALKPDDILVTEVGQCQMWAAHFCSITRPRTFISSGGLGTMGFGFPAAMGAKVARPDRNVIDIAGDGSFLMNCQELATVVENDIPVVVTVFNNRYLGMVRQWQEIFYDRRYSGVDLGTQPDFVKLAEAFGARGVRVERPEEIAPAVREAFKSGMPTVIDVMIAHEENILPMVPPGRCLKDIIE